MSQKFVLQWHILHTCNLRCTHCYQEDRAEGLDFTHLETIFDQFIGFCRKNRFSPHVNFTGGEPFLSADLPRLLSLCEGRGVPFGILTNGTLLTKETVNGLKGYRRLSFVQVSIDGGEKVHDKIRGDGSYQKAFYGLKLLRKARIRTMVSFTCGRGNKDELKKVIKKARRSKVDHFWCDRLIPAGSCREEGLSTEEYRKVIRILTEEQKRRGTFIHTDRAIQFLEGGDGQGRCSAGSGLLAVLADGTLLPCRRLPIALGNVLSQPMAEIYENSPVIRDLCKKEIPEGCISCLKAESCRGGAKCVSYALAKRYDIKDVNCYGIDGYRSRPREGRLPLTAGSTERD